MRRAGQAAALERSVKSVLAWHRARGLSHGDLVWGYDAIRGQAREGLHRAGGEIGDLLDRVAPGQIEQIERRFGEDNRAFAREHVERTPEELRSRRLRRTVKALEVWLGELDHAVARLGRFARGFEELAAR